EYLDTVSGLDAIENYKRRSHQLLNPEPGDHLLDMGCGTGDDVIMLAEHVGPDGLVFGIDRSESIIQTATDRSKNISNVSFWVDNALDLALDSNVVDGCRSDRVLQHLPDPTIALAEMIRITKPGCQVVMSEPNWNTLEVRIPIADADVTDEIIDIEWANERNPRIGSQLYSLARKSGLTDIHVDPITVVITDFEVAEQVFQLENRLKRVKEGDILADRSSKRWISQANQADAKDIFFSSISGFTVAGTVPEK
ncbi:MAG: methyltransferase domain-containing protein, partial [Halobacteriaceae archaeon]